MKHKSEDTTEKQVLMVAGIGLVIGAALGTIVGLLFLGEIALGTGIGAAIGLLIGASIDAQTRDDSAK